MAQLKNILFITTGIGIGLLIGALVVWQFAVVPLRSDLQDYGKLLDDYDELLENYDDLISKYSRVVDNIDDFNNEIGLLIEKYKQEPDPIAFSNELITIVANFLKTVAE